MIFIAISINFSEDEISNTALGISIFLDLAIDMTHYS
jgi:hypothetical protein